MPLNSAAMTVGAEALQAALRYAKLHSADATDTYTANLCASTRQAISWVAPTGLGSFGLGTPILFTGGGVGNPVYSVTLWNTADDTCYGQFVVAGDSTFDVSGNFTLTAIDITGTAT